ncbi:acetaldehyde dehydrogenase (acetylating) [Trinickia fusca]|uniref:Acetaldehyde dehydrogenase n=2 Tax=Trinickia fusca TaxID=2419777 RepID=A0A494XMH7_9BURK|nr:acetaldehyde dehydrogenase (acetylating) [Trinickia fusca]RKP49309.1 acetaldehyde dehydrogenase (acetylating) [Trinickia fusca]
MNNRVAIIGSGNIGCDLLTKVKRSRFLSCAIVAGQRPQSPGIAYAKSLGVRTSADGVSALLNDPDSFDMVFDATSALAHMQHARFFEEMGKTIIDLTPSARGKWCVPVINGGQMSRGMNINMVTCGGQAAAPIAHALATASNGVEYVEVVSSISATSAGPATRLNVNEYLSVTEAAIRGFAKCDRAKAILNINPAVPPVTMQTTVFAKLRNADEAKVSEAVHAVVEKVTKYVPGYELIVEPRIDGDRWMTMVRVQGAGAYLPSYAGNLDIITSAAVQVAETISNQQYTRGESHVDRLR